jgi:outer membrane protein assembly factor BamD (BamD/ComL family)
MDLLGYHTGSKTRWRRLIGLPLVVLAGGCSIFTPRTSDQEFERLMAERAKRAQGAVAPVASQKPKTTITDVLDIDEMSKTISKKAKEYTGYGPNRNIAQEAFDAAEQKYQEASKAEGDQRKNLFSEAAPKFVLAASRWPESALEEDSLFKSGEAYFFSDQYSYAAGQYEKLLKGYPNSRYRETVSNRRFDIGRYWLEINNKDPHWPLTPNMTDDTRPLWDTPGEAMRIFDKLRLEDPTGKLADDAVYATANAHFANGDYITASGDYKALIDTYPHSEHQFDAHFMRLQAELYRYQGADYSADSLDEADKMIRQIKKQFPDEAEKHRVYLNKSYLKARFAKADRLYKRGQYYEWQGYNRSARIFYDKVKEEFGDTKFSKDADDRLVAIASLPDEPPKHFKWLVDLFPERSIAKPIFTSDAPKSTSKKRR